MATTPTPCPGPFGGTLMHNLATRDPAAADRIEVAFAELLGVLARESDTYDPYDLSADGVPVLLPDGRTITQRDRDKQRMLSDALADALVSTRIALLAVAGTREGVHRIIVRWFHVSGGSMLTIGDFLGLLARPVSYIRAVGGAHSIQHVMCNNPSWRRERDRMGAFVEAVRAAICPPVVLVVPAVSTASPPRLFAGCPMLQELDNLLLRFPEGLRRNAARTELYPLDNDTDAADRKFRRLLIDYRKKLPAVRPGVRLVATRGNRRDGCGEIRLEWTQRARNM